MAYEKNVLRPRACLLAGGLCLLASGSGLGQVLKQRATDSEQGAPQNVLQVAPSDVRKPVLRAQKAIADGRYADAARELGELLLNDAPGDAETQDYFLGESDSKQPRGRVSLKGEARRLLASLPKAGRDSYELQFGAQARALLDAAVAAGDLEKLDELTRRFPQTQAAYEALILSSRFELGRGRPVAAALALQRLADTPQAAAQFEPELSVLLATCWLCAHLEVKATATLAALKQSHPQATLRLGNEEVKLFADNRDSLAVLQASLGSRSSVAAAEAAEWLLHRGNAQRNGRTKGGTPVMNFRWRVPTPLDRADEKVIEQQAKQYRDEGKAAVPALQPLAIGDTVLMRTPEKIMGVDFRSGKRIWVWPPWDDEPSERERVPAPAQRGQPGVASREQELHQRIWDDAIYGQVSSDGRSVYLVHDLSYAVQNNQYIHQLAFGGVIGRNLPGQPRSSNTLVSLSLARQGAAQWVVGGEQGEDEPKLAGAFFLGAPLPLGDRLYAMAEFSGEIRLVALNARNGRLDWQQQLAHVDTAIVTIDAGRRLAGASPSYAEGILLCPTSAGAVVAVELASRSLLWGYQYLKPPASANPNFGFQNLVRPAKPVGARWADATITIADGRVLVTAIEADELHALDLLTGKLLWPPVKREDPVYVACVHQDAIVLVGTSTVNALRLSNGSAAWTKPLPLSDAPSGRGFYSGHFYYLPTQRAELLKIDLDKGELAGRTSTSVVLGNLLCHREEVVSQGPDWLTTFPEAEPLQRRVEQLLAANPNDVQALASRGELCLQAGQRAEAIATLEKAHQLAPSDEGIRTFLVSAMLGALSEDFNLREQYGPRIEKLLDRPQQRTQYLRLLANGWQKSGQIEKSFAAYLDLAKARSAILESNPTAPPELERVERTWKVRVDRWLQARISELLAATNDQQRAALEQTIREQFEAALQSREREVWQRFVSTFGTHPLADQIRLRLAGSLIDGGDLLEAELLLSRLEVSSDKTLCAAATAEMARLLERGRQTERAVAYYRELAQRWPDTVCRAGQTGRQIAEAALANRALQDGEIFSRPWPYGRVTVSESNEPREAIQNFRRLFTCRMPQRTPASPAGLRAAYDQNRNSLSMRDGWGQLLIEVSLGAYRLNTPDFSLIQARANGHLTVFSLGNELLAVNLLRGGRNRPEAILWRQDLGRANPETNNIMQIQVPIQILKHPWGPTRRVFADPNQRLWGATGPVLENGIFYLTLRELICANPLTGETIWSREGLPQGSDLFGDQELLFVVPPGSEEARVFSTLDGRELGTRKVNLLENRWATHGRNVLAWRQANDTAQLELWLYDAWTGKEIWREQVSTGSKGELVEDDEVAVLEPASGRCFIRSLEDNRVRLEAKLEPVKNLLALYVLRSQKQYLVAANRQATAESRTNEIEIQAFSYGFFAPMLTGQLYAFDRVSGKPQWQVPANIDGFGFPTEQPSESPLLVFMRHLRPTAQRVAVARQQTAVLCLDRRDGRSVLAKDDIPNQSVTYEIAADPREHTVTLSLPVKSLVLKLTDEPIPPEPPAQTGAAGGLGADLKAAEAATEAVGSTVRPLGRAIAVPNIKRALIPAAK